MDPWKDRAGKDWCCNPDDNEGFDLCGIVCGGIRREAEGITQALDA